VSSGKTPPGAPHIVLLVLDTLRADHLACYGYDRPTSPALDALATESTLYEHAVAPSPWTLPSHASMFTGLYPSEHGAHCFLVEESVENAYPLPPETVTIAEVLRGHGFRTAAFVANAAYLRRSYQLDQGFDSYRVRRQRAAAMNPSIVQWLDDRGPDAPPFFLFVNYMDTHQPYNTAPGPGFLDDAPAATEPQLIKWLYQSVVCAESPFPADLARRVIDQYDTAVAHTDRAVGELIAALKNRGLWEETLVIVTSDHGEYFGEHGFVEHPEDVYEPALQVPLLVKSPGQTRAQRRADPVSLVALPGLIAANMDPATADALSENFPRTMEDAPVIAELHHSLMRDLTNPRCPGRFDRIRRAVYDGSFKLIHSSDGTHELYDLSTDREETHNLASAHPERVRQLAARIEAMLAAAPAPRTTDSTPAPTERELETLRTLGYVD
jgi:arylsulfatase A-like enzyme